MRHPNRAARRARLAVAAVFFTNGALFANVLPRYPQLKSELGLDNAALGAAIAAMPFGALVCGMFAARVIGRFGSMRTASVGVVFLATATALVGFANSWLMLAGAFLAAGAMDAVVDVAQNAHAMRVQRVYGRSIVNGLHGLWSIGAVTGGLMGSAAAGLDVPIGTHLIVSGAVFSTVALVAARFMLPGPDSLEKDAADLAAQEAAGEPVAATTRGAAWRTLIVLGVIAASGALVEDAAASWGALYMRNTVGTGAAVAGLAFVAMQGAMTTGRLLGDRAVDRFGQLAVTRAGGLATAVAMLGAILFPSIPTVLLGFAVSGLGFATVVPAAYHASDEVRGVGVGVGLTVVGWLLRVGFLFSPPIVGAVADATSLRVGLLVAPLAGVAVALLAPRLEVGRPASRPAG